MLNPIRPDEPAGIDVSFDPEFEMLEAEIRKMESVSGGTVDWPQVVSRGEAILKGKSKDFRAASYLALGLFQVKGLAGMLEGLELYRGLIEAFWESGFPAAKRVRVRQNAVLFLVEKLEEFLARGECPDRGPAAGCVAALTRLEAQLRSALDDKAPSLASLKKALENIASDMAGSRNESTAKAAPPGRIEEPGPSAGPQAKPPVRPPVDQASPDPAPTRTPAATPDLVSERELNDISRTLRRAAWNLRNISPRSEAPYRLLRAAAWLNVTELPPHENGRTRLPAPPPDVMGNLENLVATGRWEELSDQTETLASEYLFWLDPHFWSHLALEKRGPDFDPARQAVELAVSAFFRRLPELVDLKFENGRPFVSPAARAWLEKISAAPQPDPAAPALAAGDEFTAQMSELVREARELNRKGDLRQAMVRMQQARDHAPAGRSRFLCQLKMAQFCLEIDRPDLAAPQLQGLENMIGHFSLEQWDPSLCAEVYRDLYLIEKKKLREAPNPTPEQRRMLEDVFSRLARVDAAAAVDVRAGREG
ncbi:MAG: type VI secretion system protein TssA [Pseudomonadota bacterium]